jgi:GntR family transcriptional repressor for pyruvate dehydrogenase complex
MANRAEETQAPLHEGARGTLGELLQFIRQRGFEPGERLPSERELAERFEVSRNTIREALSTLEWFRFVERRPSSGVYLREEVTDPSLEAMVLATGAGIELNEDEVMQSMETRHLLEEKAVRLCCLRRNDADLARLGEVLDRTAQVIAEGGNIADLDSAFHLSIVAGTQNAVLVRVVRPFYLLSGPRRARYFADLSRARKSLADHRKLYAAIEAQDEEGASRVLQGHLGTVEDYWRGALRKAAVDGAKRGPRK